MNKQAQFTELFDKHYTKVFSLCKGYFNGNDTLASDSAQEVFIKIWESLDSFRGESNISTWIYRISVNTCLLYLRKQSTKKEKTTSVFPPIATEQYSLEEEEKLQKMYGCIQKLEEKEKMITLMMLEGIGYKEISEVVGITEEALRVRIHRIKKNLTQCVQHGKI
ncbi:MAG: sigma-70 family RNA polymerase sigma factor [Cyclobacteriaceae bacterium]